jgi:Hemerythrin HHE cation binding domain
MAPRVDGMADTDITSLIMDDHEWFRRQFAALDYAKTNEELAAIWEPLATRLEAEEFIFYPALLKRGDQDPQEETDDAIRDHNKIRDAVAESRKHPVGTDEWFEAVGHARNENTEHIGEEEDQGLPDFRKHASAELSAALALKWAQFYAAHPHGEGIDIRDRDPKAYIEENER